MNSVIPAEETFEGTWPFAAHYSHRPGFAQHYVDEGPGSIDAENGPNGQDDAERAGAGQLVLLHGEPTWGYLWRHLVGPLSRRHRVVVPDHMGFGKSGDPQDRTYLAGEHVANLESLLVDELDLRDITLVLHDWGGVIGTGFALRHPDRVRAIFATNTFLPLGLPGQGEPMAANQASAWFTWARRAQADSTLEQVLGNAGHTVTHLMLALQTLTHPENVTATWVRAYSAHFSDRGACEGVIRFPQQIVAPQGPPPPAPDPDAVAAVLAKPAMLAVGLHDTALLPHLVTAAFRVAYPHAPVVDLPGAGHFPSEDAPEALLALLELFLQTTAQPRTTPGTSAVPSATADTASTGAASTGAASTGTAS